MGEDLVFDIGLNNGDDAAYYLHLGYRVVGVEANPVLAEQATLRFADQIRTGRMTVVNVGVLKEPGVFTFYRNLVDSAWSSFEPDWGKKRGKWEEIPIPCVTTQQLIAEHGKPFFMKIDIEGADLQAVHTLTPLSSPSYISLELNETDAIVERLIELGYTGFKFIDGETFWSAPPIFDHQIGWRLLRKAGRWAPFVRTAIAQLPERFRAKSEWNPSGKYSPDHYPFTEQSSGPFGEHASGSWMPPAVALKWFAALINHYRRAGKSPWWDVHARHFSASKQ